MNPGELPRRGAVTSLGKRARGFVPSPDRIATPAQIALT
jgi:hypothetical protein